MGDPRPSPAHYTGRVVRPRVGETHWLQASRLHLLPGPPVSEASTLSCTLMLTPEAKGK